MHISVVIPLFNKKDAVLRAIGSMVPQLEDGDEVIIVDDGSTDGGSDAVASQFPEFLPLRVIKQDNRGVSAARNEGIRRAGHEHIVLLDADDWWLDGARKKLEELVKRWPNADAWSIGYYRVDGTERVYIKSGLSADSLLEGPEFVALYGKASGLIHSSTACIRKAAFFDTGGFPEGVTSGEDVYFWLRIGLQGSVAASPAPLVCVERSLSGRSENKGRDVVGFHYRYFGDRKNLTRFGSEQRSAIKRFLVRNGLRQVAGSVSGGHRGAGWQQAKAIGRVVPWFPLLAVAIMVCPRGVLVSAFRRRHRLLR